MKCKVYPTASDYIYSEESSLLNDGYHPYLGLPYGYALFALHNLGRLFQVEHVVLLLEQWVPRLLKVLCIAFQSFFEHFWEALGGKANIIPASALEGLVRFSVRIDWICFAIFSTVYRSKMTPFRACENVLLKLTSWQYIILRFVETKLFFGHSSPHKLDSTSSSSFCVYIISCFWMFSPMFYTSGVKPSAVDQSVQEMLFQNVPSGHNTVECRNASR